MEARRFVQVVGALALLLVAAEGARILAVFPMPARSHHIAFCAVTKALADKGHEVTIITGLDKDNKILPANNKIVSIGNLFASLVEDELESFWEQEKSSFEQLLFLVKIGKMLVNGTLNNPLFKAEIKNKKYDLILSEVFFFQEGFMGLAHHFNCPVVAFNPFGASPQINAVMGNPVNPSWVPSPFLGFSDRMSFVERAFNSLMYVLSDIMYNQYHIPLQQSLIEEHFPGAPPLQDMLRSQLLLTLVNNHFTLAYPTPMSPNVLEVGGMHITDKPKPLPKDLQDFMDSAKDGVVYFSMGSNLRMDQLGEQKAKAIFNALGSIKQKVLLKWDGPIKNHKLADNIRLTEWAPQSDLLGHPNLRVFVTHGGLLSTQEAVYRGVPVVGIPVFGDQDFNMMLATQKGFGIKVDLKTLSAETLSAALKEMLGNPK